MAKMMKVMNRNYALMTPMWLMDGNLQRSNVWFGCSIDGPSTNDNQIVFSTDAKDNKFLFKVKILESADDFRNLVVKCRVVLVHKGPQDSIYFFVGDEDWNVGFQLAYSYSDGQTCPYFPTEGKSEDIMNPLVRQEVLVPSGGTTIPRIYDMTFNITEKDAVGICSSSLDAGHLVNTTYSNTLDTTSEMFLWAYRGKSSTKYTINFVEVEVSTLE